MAITVDQLINDDRFCGENVLHFLLYTPLGILLLAIRTVLALVLWIASIVLPNKPAVNQMLSTLACWTFGVYVKMRGTKDPRCSVMVANYVSCLDSLAASHVLGTISLRKWKVPPFFASTLGIRNAAQFVKKQEFAECPRKPVLLQPEGGPTNGQGLLRFTDWPLPLPSRLQPLIISESTDHHPTQYSLGLCCQKAGPQTDRACCGSLTGRCHCPVASSHSLSVPIYCLSPPINMVKEASGRDSPAEWSEPVEGGTELALRLRLSHTCKDVDLSVYSKHTIAHCKNKLHAQENIEVWRQRWFYGGKLLGDRLTVEEARITPGYIVQVIVSMEPQPPS